MRAPNSRFDSFYPFNCVSCNLKFVISPIGVVEKNIICCSQNSIKRNIKFTVYPFSNNIYTFISITNKFNGCKLITGF